MENKQKHSEELSDQMIKELFNNFCIEEAPKSLKTETMNRVFSDWTEHANTYKPIINKNNRWWLLGGFAALLSISFLIDSSVIIDYWNQVKLNNSFIDLSALFKNMGKVGTTIQSLPSIVYFTLGGIILLLGIDRFFNRLANI